MQEMTRTLPPALDSLAHDAMADRADAICQARLTYEFARLHSGSWRLCCELEGEADQLTRDWYDRHGTQYEWTDFCNPYALRDLRELEELGSQPPQATRDLGMEKRPDEPDPETESEQAPAHALEAAGDGWWNLIPVRVEQAQEQRDIGQELLDAVREIKSGKGRRVTFTPSPPGRGAGND
jgi:hypothetical protein